MLIRLCHLGRHTMDCIELINNTVLNEIKSGPKFITLVVSFFITLVVILITLVVSITLVVGYYISE